jgi:hypothetical protein
MAIKQEFRKFVIGLAAEYTNIQTVRLGRLDGVTVETGTSGLLWARQWNGKEIQVINHANASSTFDLRVLVGVKKIQPSRWVILQTMEDYLTPADAGRVAHHHAQHELYGPDEVAVQRKQITAYTVRVLDGPGFIVRVYGGYFRSATGFGYTPTQSMDLSTYVVATGAKFVAIEVDDDGVLSVHEGDPFDALEVGTIADVPAPEPGKYHVAAVAFYDGQTELLETDISVPMPLGGGVAQDHVDLTTDQTAAGRKRFSDSIQIGLEPLAPEADGGLSQTAEGVSAGHLIWTFTDEEEVNSFITGLLANGTQDVPTAVLADQIMLELRGRAHNGVTFVPSNTAILLLTNEDQTDEAEGSRMEFWVTPDGTTTPILAFTIHNNGDVEIGAGKNYLIDGVPVGGGGSGGAFQRNLAADLTLADGESLVVAGYINGNGHTLTVEGDAALRIL